MKKVLFIHRSVGRNLIADSRFYGLLEQSKVDFEFHDYDHNNGKLFNGVKKLQLGIKLKGGDTKPKDYAMLFSNTQVVGEQKRAQDFVMGYDVVVIKSCYPNSHIMSDGDLDVIKSHYSAIAEFFANHPDKRLIILTSPPLVPRKTKPAAATRARQLANWMTETDFGSNVSVFDFYNLLAERDSAKQANTLKKDYRRKWPWDSHPNKLAAHDIAPALLRFIEERAR